MRSAIRGINCFNSFPARERTPEALPTGAGGYTGNHSSHEGAILKKLGFFDSQQQSSIQVIISQELIEQILRVGKRLQNKDWGARIVDEIWRNLNWLFVPETDELNAEAKQIFANQLIPSEDILIYLTAKYGEADYFVSGNRELIKVIADFPCLTPEEFVRQFLTTL